MLTVLAVLLVVVAWLLVTGWYLIFGIWLVPYRLLRRGARKRKKEALRHREMMGTIQGAAAASSAPMARAMSVEELMPIAVQPLLGASSARELEVGHAATELVDDASDA